MTDREEDYYQLLGVERAAKGDEIKSSYRKLAMEWHPDRKPGDEGAAAKFKKISQAYAVLRDPQKRAVYDKLGHSAFRQAEGFGGAGAAGRAGGFGGFGGFGDGDVDINDLLNEVFGSGFGGLFGGGRRGGGVEEQRRGRDVEASMSVSLEEAFSGVRRRIQLNVLVACESCEGTGSADKEVARVCDQCRGRGRQVERRGLFAVQRPCGGCGGLGRIVESACRRCRGQGRIEGRPEIEVRVPAGVESGMRLRLPGKGEAAPFGEKSGDLYIVLEVLAHEVFERHGEILLMGMPLAFGVAAIGGEVEIVGIDGRILAVQIPGGTQSGSRLRLALEGMPQLHGEGSRGDLLVEVRVEVPRSLKGVQAEHLRKFAESLTSSEQPQVAKFTRRVGEARKRSRTGSTGSAGSTGSSNKQADSDTSSRAGSFGFRRRTSGHRSGKSE
ncbi:MAG: molecular chaperone DnaJ [Alphaproteobacteria bacterium]